MCRFSYFISTVCELFLGSVFLFSSVLLFVLVVSGMQRCVSTWRSGVSGTAGLHAAHTAGEADHGLLPARVPGGAHSSGTAGHGSVWAFQHSCQGTQHPTHHNPSPPHMLMQFFDRPAVSYQCCLKFGVWWPLMIWRFTTGWCSTARRRLAKPGRGAWGYCTPPARAVLQAPSLLRYDHSSLHSLLLAALGSWGFMIRHHLFFCLCYKVFLPNEAEKKYSLQ